MKTLALVSFLFFSLTSFCQNPLVKQWDYRYGGTKDEHLSSLLQTTDGGYILGGLSYSGISGNKSQANWDTINPISTDYWIVKTDSLGNIEWDKVFGGKQSDALWSLQQTTDGGYILGGYSLSPISGNKTQPSWGATDYWIVKIDSLGNFQWDKDFGTTNYDSFTSLQQTTDGGYILGGYTYSGISGNKTQPTWGGWDYWIIKVDSLGNIQWDKDFGGTSTEYLRSIKQTADGGYIFGGTSASGIGGDKTQPSWGSGDYWVVKTDSVGNIQWDKDFGGTNDDGLYSLQQTTDGGYILGGLSTSGIGGVKTQPTWGGLDYWIVKIDSLGDIEWDKDIGSTAEEYAFSNVTQTADGGYLISGTSNSDSSGNKTENNLGINQSWIVKIDSLGNIQWDKTIFTLGNDGPGEAIQASDECYVVANWSFSGVGGYKTQPEWNNSYDYWIVKFCDCGPCSAPVNPFTTNITSTYAKLNWTTEDCAFGYKIQYRPLGSASWMSTSQNNNLGHKNISGLTPNTTYKWRVKTECNINPIQYSANSAIQTFTTALRWSNEAEEIETIVSISPNPFTSTATLTINQPGRFDFMLYDVYGREALRSQILNSKSQIERGNLPAGVYFYKVVENEKMIGSGKVVVE